MDANKILKADWLDILFEGRNKAYGAYQLRRTYPKRVITSLVVVVGAVALIFAGTTILGKKKTSGSTVLVEDVKLENVNLPKTPPPPKEDKPQPPPPARKTVTLPNWK